jgi:uncharacterized protein YdhG (YjbR/CyaY superfamily)
MAEPTTVDEYFAALPAEKRPAMETLRTTIRAAAPEAAEVISYKMPAFKTFDRFLVSYDAYKHHYSLFPASDAVVEALGKEIEPYLAGRGTIRFPAGKPIPVETVTKVIEVRLRENEAAAAAKGKSSS